MRNSVKNRAAARFALHYTDTREGLAFEKTRRKPEDVRARTFERVSFWSALVNRVRDWFSRLFGLGWLDMGRPTQDRRHLYRGHGAKAGRTAKKLKTTKPRVFGKAGRKLARHQDPVAVARAMKAATAAEGR